MDRIEPGTQPLLDLTKLFGFRNLTRVMAPSSEIGVSADLAFHKRGTETIA